MRLTHQQIESVKDWVRAAWVVALVVGVLLWTFGEGRSYDDHMRIVATAVFASFSLLGLLIGLLFPYPD